MKIECQGELNTILFWIRTRNHYLIYHKLNENKSTESVL